MLNRSECIPGTFVVYEHWRWMIRAAKLDEATDTASLELIHRVDGGAAVTVVNESDPCDACYGLGAVFEHLPSCESDFCVGNGDEHSCNGTWVLCEACDPLGNAADPL